MTYLHSDGFTERGAAPFDLAVESENSVTVAGAALVEVGGRTALQDGTLRPFISVGLGGMSDDGWAATARLAEVGVATAGFRASTPLPNVAGKVSAGIDLYASENWELKLQYDGGYGDRYTFHTGIARIGHRIYARDGRRCMPVNTVSGFIVRPLKSSIIF